MKTGASQRTAEMQENVIPAKARRTVAGHGNIHQHGGRVVRPNEKQSLRRQVQFSMQQRCNELTRKKMAGVRKATTAAASDSSKLYVPSISQTGLS